MRNFKKSIFLLKVEVKIGESIESYIFIYIVAIIFSPVFANGTNIKV